ncbi:MAG: hypothetical protein R3C15_07490 [Thermoleophilia bacterium]
MTASSDYELPRLLGVRAVAERYGCDVRAARRIMREAGALVAAGRLLVRVDLLDAWERARTSAAPADPPPSRARRSRPQHAPTALNRLEAGWWQQRA